MNHIDNYKINKMLMNVLYQKKDFHGALQEALKILKNNSSDIETISFTGIGLHTGVNVNVSIKPANPDTGIIFKRVDLNNNNIVYTNFLNVSNT